MKKEILIFFILIIAVFTTGCVSGNMDEDLADSTQAADKTAEQYEEEINQYKIQVEELQNEIDDIKDQYEELILSYQTGMRESEDLRIKLLVIINEKLTLRDSGVYYFGLDKEEYVRYISNAVELRAAPYDDSSVIRDIEENTLVIVIDKVSNTGDINDVDTIWYNVIVPVYDTPGDNRGWIKYTETSEYNLDNQKTLQSDVTIRIGAKYTEGDVTDFQDEGNLKTCSRLIRGRITNREGEYVFLECAGGMVCWVKQVDLIYPEIP